MATDQPQYALTVRPPGVDSVTVPEDVSPDVFNTAMDTARSDFADQLAMQGGHLGVFRDDELGRIDIDPVVVVDNLHDVETIGAATHAVGGAYNFQDGNGYWPPHVASAAPALAGVRSRLPAHRYERRGQPRPPLNYRPMGTMLPGAKALAEGSCCAGCDMNDRGLCWGYANVRIEGDHVCDSWKLDAAIGTETMGTEARYSDDQPRDENGKWTGGDGGGDSGSGGGGAGVKPEVHDDGRIDRTMSSNQGNPDAVAEVPDSEAAHYKSSWYDFHTGTWRSDAATTGDTRMDTELRYWETPEYRDKYSDDDRKAMAKQGHTLPDGSYPIGDQDDLDKAIHAVGRGGADHDAIRKHIIASAARLGHSDAIPDNWNADGSLKPQNNSAGKRRERRKERHRAVPLGREVRYFAPTQVEVRQATADSPEIIITGATIMYGVPYRVVDFFGEFRETIHSGSAASIVDKVDCRFLFNHDGMPMARTASRTMKLADSPDALRFRAVLDARQQLANDFAIAIERGDISQMSVGMIVDRDKWGNDAGMETRDIFNLGDLPDISGVTYPCSPTTHIEVAKRMAFAMPLQTRARLREMEVELRAGKVLSADSQSKLVSALASLHDLATAGGVDPANYGPNSDEEDGELQTHADGSEGSTSSAPDAGGSYPDGSGSRSAPETEAERRELSLSYGDRQTAVYEALLRSHPTEPDEMCDLWVRDLGDDWVVYQSYRSPAGMFRCAYTMDDDGTVTFDGEPEPVQARTSYVPVQRSDDPLADLADDGCPIHEDEEEESEGAPEGSVEEPAEGGGDEPRMKASTLRLLVEAGRKPSA